MRKIKTVLWLMTKDVLKLIRNFVGGVLALIVFFGIATFIFAVIGYAINFIFEGDIYPTFLTKDNVIETRFSEIYFCMTSIGMLTSFGLFVAFQVGCGISYVIDWFKKYIRILSEK